MRSLVSRFVGLCNTRWRATNDANGSNGISDDGGRCSSNSFSLALLLVL